MQGTVAALSLVCLGWILVSIAYLGALRHLLEACATSLTRDLEQLAANIHSWEQAFQEVGHREWREEAAGIDQVLEVLTGSAGITEKVLTAAEMRRLLVEEKAFVSREPSAFGPGIADRVREIEESLDRLEARFEEYRLISADAVFALKRFPLSLLAALTGLGEEWGVA